MAEHKLTIGPEKQRALQRLRDWRAGGTSFGCVLYSLICKADEDNLEHLRKGYPQEVETYIEWQQAPSLEEYLSRFKLHSHSEE